MVLSFDGYRRKVEQDFSLARYKKKRGLQYMTEAAAITEPTFYDVKEGVRKALRDSYWDKNVYSDTCIFEYIYLGYCSYPDAQYIFHSSDGDQAVSLKEMYENSHRIARALYQLGVREGDRIAIQVPNCPEAIQTFHAAMLLGAVVIPIIHIYGVAEVDFILRKSEAKVLFITDQWRNTNYLARIPGFKKIPCLENIIVIGNAGDYDVCELNDLLPETDGEFPRPTQHPDTLCLIVFTSGTTSEPKGVCHSHNTLTALIANIIEFEENSADAVDLLPFPAGHIGGVVSTLKPYFSGTTSILIDSWNAGEVAGLIEKYQVSNMPSTPLFLNTLMVVVEEQGLDISALKQTGTGATYVAPAIVERCEDYGITAYRTYGSSEQPYMTVGAQFDSLEKRACTDGRPARGCEIKIIDEQGDLLPAGEKGEIIAIGPQQFLGYLDEAHNWDTFTPDGWFKTGDIGYLDEGGHLTLSDRKKDIIIRGGENIASSEVEAILLTHPDITEAAVVAMADKTHGEKVCAFLITRGGKVLSVKELIAYFSSKGVAKQKTPEHVVIRDDFPRTPTGKVKKVVLRNWLNSKGSV